MGIFSSKPVDDTRAQVARTQEIHKQRWLQRQTELQFEINVFSLARRQEETRKSQIRPSQPPERKLNPLANLIQAKVTADLKVLNELALALGEQPIHEYPLKPYQETVLSKTSWEFSAKASLFKNTNKHFFSISQITSVHNIFNSLHYQLAKVRYDKIYNEGCAETLVFHGTKQEFLAGICSYNFDRSKMKTHKFGHGISFATNSYYATHYHHDNQRNLDKVMIIAKVLVGDTIEIGNEFMTIPNQMCYTSTNPTQSVIVKYDDHTFFPQNIVYYQGLHPSKNSGSRYYD